jgi:hypothetical protein
MREKQININNLPINISYNKDGIGDRFAPQDRGFGLLIEFMTQLFFLFKIEFSHSTRE